MNENQKLIVHIESNLQKGSALRVSKRNSPKITGWGNAVTKIKTIPRKRQRQGNVFGRTKLRMHLVGGL